MAKLPTRHWRALRPGYFELNNEPLNVVCHRLGELPLPSGRLVIKDSAGFSRIDQRAINVIPGQYQLQATCIEQGKVSLLAYLSLELQAGETESFKSLSLTHKYESEEDLPRNLKHGFINRTSYAMMIDEHYLKEHLPLDDEHCYSLLCYWQNQLDDRPSPWQGHVFPLGPEQDKPALAFFNTKQMQGQTRLWGEFDKIGILLKLHVDLGTSERLHRLAARQKS